MKIRTTLIAVMLVTTACETTEKKTVVVDGKEKSITTCKYAENKNKEVGKAQCEALRICQYVPTATTILEILALGVPNLDKGAKIANAICDKIVEGGKRGEVKTIEGIVIRGQFE